jgi:phage I-like protein
LNKSLIVCSILITLNLEALSEFKIAVTGKWQGHVTGPFEITLDDLNQMKKNFDDAKVDGVIDLDHATVLKGTGEAYGWIKELEVRGKELFAKVEWLEHGKTLIKEKKYKYISPVLQPNTIEQGSGANIGWTIHSAALTNRPFLEELGELVVNNNQIQTKGENGMTPEQEKELADLKAENKILKDEKETVVEQAITASVDAAIAANKVAPEQKDSLITLGKANPAALTDLLAKAKAFVQVPGNDMYLNNNQNNQEEKIDVLKLGGIN